MRKTVVIIAAVILLAVLLIVFLPKNAETPPNVQDEYSKLPENWDRVIAYVPLDDRPDNIDNVIYLAEASGYRVVMPENDLIHTSLDGQPKNSNGTQFGDREALLQWVRNADAQGCDLFLLSLDQLMSGGLVNSRALSGSFPLKFDDGSMSEREAFDKFILALGDDANNRVYMFDSVVRLASTVGYQGFDYEEYTAIRTYGKVARPSLSGDELTLENIFAAYRWGADGITPAEEYIEDAALTDILTDEVMDNYLAARERKLQLLDHVISAIEDEPQFKLLVGIDDSSNTSNIQTNELAYISRRLGENATLISGLDCLARLMVGTMAQEEYGYNIKAYVEYFGGTEKLPPSDYDSYMLSEVVDLHMKLYNAVYAEENAAELQVIVMTKPAEESRRQEYIDALIAKLVDNQKKNIPTVFIEASNTAYGKMLEDELVANVDLARLMGFSGKYYQANVIGSGFAMGFSRYLYLKCCDDKSPACDEAQLRHLVLSTEMSYAFAINSRDQLNSYVTDMGYNFNNILWSSGDRDIIMNRTAELMQFYGAPILENFTEGEVPCGLEPYEARQVETVSMSDFRMPWDRTFEISFNIDAEIK